MRKTFSRIALAAAAILLLGSCSKINERIDKLEVRIDGIENETIKTIDGQISSINSSIADLGTIRTNIQNLTSTTAAQAQDIKDLNNEDTEIGKKISDLKKADESINTRIDNLQKYVNDTLKAYATTEWVKATFSTLAQYEATCDTIAKIDARIGDLDTRLSKAIEDCADSLKAWVNVQLDAYYTAAQMDATVAELQAAIDTASAVAAATADSLSAELSATKAAIDTAKANIRTEYRAAIDTAISASEGKLTRALTDAIAEVNGKITSLTTRVGNLETSVADLTGRVTALENMIQSVVIVPAYSDGSVAIQDGNLYLDCIINPATAVAALDTADFKILLAKVQTKAVALDTVPTDSIKVFTKDITNGSVSIKANIKEILVELDSSLAVSVNVKKYKSDYSSGFVPAYVDKKTFKAVYKAADSTLTFHYDAAVDHSGEGTVYDNLPTAATKAADWGYNENSNRSKIKSVVIDASVAGYKGLTSTAYMFQGMTKATGISGAQYLDVSNVTDMSCMFQNFGGGSTDSHTTLNSVPDVSNWNTANVTNMAGMFNSYGNFSDSLAIVPDVSKWNTANVTNMNGMFQKYGYSSTKFNAVPDVSGWNTARVENMTSMFDTYATSSTALDTIPDVSKWNTASVTNMNSMFDSYGASSNNLNKVPDVSKWNTGRVTNMGDMFLKYGYTSTALDTVPDVSKWKTDSVETMTNMFQNYGYSSTALSTVPNVSSWKTGKVTSMANMFKEYGKTSTNISCVLDLSGWDLSKITSGDAVFDFTPHTFTVTIPAKTGSKDNDDTNWYYGNGGNGGSINPPSGKNFTLP